MIDTPFLKELSERATRLLPAAEAARQKAEQEIFKLLQASLSPLNLVSREEFEAQVRVLEQAQEKITVLETKLQNLESRGIKGDK